MVIDLKSVFLLGNELDVPEYQIGADTCDLFFGSCLRDGKLFVSAKVRVKQGDVVMRINCRIEFICRCDRCLNDVNIRDNYSFFHILSEPGKKNNNDCEFLEVDDFKSNLDVIAAQDVFSCFSSKVLCKKDCKGICWVCGKNLNFGECGCGRSIPDSRLEILKKLLN